MGNANGREEDATDGEDDLSGMSNGSFEVHENSHTADGVVSMDSTIVTPPESGVRTRSPLLFAPQIPVAPMQRGDGVPSFNQMWSNDSHRVVDQTPNLGVPIMITWSHGGGDVAMEGSWDNWTSRKKLQRCGKDHCVLLVLPSGIYHYKFFVDGVRRYIPDLPHIADEMGCVSNLLDVNDYVPENLQSVAEFQAPPSPDSSYSQVFPSHEDFAKEPQLVPTQLHLTVLGTENSDEDSLIPQHVVLNHLYIEKGWVPQSVVTVGLTQRFESKYVTVVLYKPLRS